MNSVNEISDALLAISHRLQRRKENVGERDAECIAMVKGAESRRESRIDWPVSEDFQTSDISQMKSAAVPNKMEKNSAHFNGLTKENFRHARLCDRRIDELLNIDVREIARMKLINIYTMQDLLGHYLIHDTPDEFYTFLIKHFQLNDKAAATITQLLYQWTRYNLDGMMNKQEADV